MTSTTLLMNQSKPFMYGFWIFCVSILFLSNNAWGFEINTHRQITDKAIDAVESTLDIYLIENVGLEGGLTASVGGMSARQWMVEGSDFEDNFPRFNNHFHDPISNDGLGGVFDSAMDWSLQPVGEQKYSWNDAREYYFKALTSPTKAERDDNWGKTFRALGQVMHLIQDMASPAHVRNDPHLSYGGNGDTDGLHDFMEIREVATYIGAGIIGPDSSMLEESGAIRLEPFSNLFDTNQYSGSNPEATLGGKVGLAEYSNANFFSDDRIPGQANVFSGISPFFRLYNHPSLAELLPAPSPSPYLTLPRLGSAPFPGARVAKYTGTQALAKFTLAHLQYDLIGQLQLDDAVYDAYSSHLIPRAVGYSAAILNYFFRGQVTLNHSKFELTGQIQPGKVCAPIPTELPGFLLVNIIIPADLDFDGTATLYYDRPDNTRVIGDQLINPPSGEELLLGLTIAHTEIADPVRWYVVLEGQAGPGAQEPRAVLANTDKTPWQFVCLH